ncbi:hypothetical protein BIY24_12065 [Halobacteriovorax marinus]|uniref:hypothetical protein n=1 Tax=Halobacteriovorax marinus TaxID=97084 RepID=UPI000BC2CCF9|nr:hypothetical protein [Halobacteriovorax marinus]ATH08655.1 hypothetical protein BIY24_12065 [Halobacteriovorax marinus]
MKRSFLFIFSLLLLASCGSSDKEREVEERENTEIQRDYVVKDASSNYKPGWIEDPEIWARDKGKDTVKYRYFSFETEPKVSRRIACDIAKANVKADIGGEIATFIDKQLATSTEGNASVDENNPNIQPLRQYVESTLAQKVQALIHGAAIVKTYWEKRSYQVELGAKKDFNAFTCAVFVRMDSKKLADAVDQAANFVANQSGDEATKSNVKKALDNAAENFNKAKRGEI